MPPHPHSPLSFLFSVFCHVFVSFLFSLFCPVFYFFLFSFLDSSKLNKYQYSSNVNTHFNSTSYLTENCSTLNYYRYQFHSQSSYIITETMNQCPYECNIKIAVIVQNYFYNVHGASEGYQ